MSNQNAEEAYGKALATGDRLWKVGRLFLEVASKPGFLGGGAFVVVSQFYKIKDLIAKAGVPEPLTRLVPSDGWLALILFLCLMGLAAFKIAERCVAAEAEVDSRKKWHEVFDCLHSVIHNTRDGLLLGERWTELQKAKKQEQRLKIAHKIVGEQLGKVEQAMDILSGRQCSVCLKVRKGGEFVSVHYGPRTDADRRRKSTSIPMQLGLAGQVFTRKEICHTNDVRNDTCFHPQEDREKFSKRYRTIVGCPVVTDGVVVAMLCVDWKDPNVYSQSMHQPLACFTDVISLAFYLCGHTHAPTPKTKPIKIP